MINYWTAEIHQAKEFNGWYKSLQNIRYDQELIANKPEFMAKYDFIIDSIISVVIPECDLDQYSPKMNIDTAKYARNLAESFEQNQTQTING